MRANLDASLDVDVTVAVADVTLVHSLDAFVVALDHVALDQIDDAFGPFVGVNAYLSDDLKKKKWNKSIIYFAYSINYK